MRNTYKKYVVIEVKDNAGRYADIQILKRGYKNLLALQKVKGKFLIKKRICKNYPSIYVNSPSREIKKWFQTRRI